MDQISFSELELIEPIKRSLEEQKYSQPTAIQAQAIPHLLGGGDVLGCAQTGTGKTAAFAIPTLQRLYSDKRARKNRVARALVLTPTRELAVQVADSFKQYGRHLPMRYAVVYGGVSKVAQINALSKGVDVLIATPGRLLDLLNQKKVRLDEVETLILDEADRMFDMGFLPDLRKILNQLPKKRQTLLFSATMPKEIAHLADKVLFQPKKIQVATASSTADLIEDSVLFVDRDNKRSLLFEILDREGVDRTIIFTRTKHRANRLAQTLVKKRIKSAAIHGNKTQNARQKALQDFSSGRVRVLVATDIVARGIDVEGVSHVINYELPNEAESYVHRIGRTARAGSSGVAISFCDLEETDYLAEIEKLLNRKVRVCEDHGQHSVKVAEQYASPSKVKKPQSARGSRRGGGNSRGAGNARRRPQKRRRSQGGRSRVNA